MTVKNEGNKVYGGRVVLKPCERKDRVDYIRSEHGYSLTKACKIINLPRRVYYYVPVKDVTEVIEKLQELTEKKPKERSG